MVTSLEKKVSRKSPSFEEALKELEIITQKLENGNLPLDEAIEFYNRGNFLKGYCETKLHEAKLKIEKIILEDGQAVSTETVEQKED